MSNPSAVRDGSLFLNISLQIFHRGFIIHVFRHFIKSKLFLTDYIIFDFKNPLKSKAQWYLYRWHQNYQPYLVEPRGIDLHFLPTGKKIMVLPPSSWRQADVHRTSALKWFDPPSSVLPKIKATLMGGFYFWQQLIIMIRFRRVSKGFTWL